MKATEKTTPDTEKPLVNELITPDILKHYLHPRDRDAHKGCFGHALLIGGNTGMTGAIRLAAEACLRIGAGRVSVATRKAHASTITINRPEIMSHGIEHDNELSALIAKATVIAIGPGLGQDHWSLQMLQSVLTNTDCPKVIDADALILLNTPSILKHFSFPRSDWILTPHPGEAGKLLNITNQAVQDNRPSAISLLQKQYGGNIILKGANTLIKEESPLFSCCPVANPGMASGGMGDVLTGVITGLLAQGLSHSTAAKVGVYLHASAGEAAATVRGERGLLASDLMPWLHQLANP